MVVVGRPVGGREWWCVVGAGEQVVPGGEQARQVWCGGVNEQGAWYQQNGRTVKKKKKGKKKSGGRWQNL